MNVTHARILSILRDGRWHRKEELVRPFSQDDRRLRECRYPHGYLNYTYRHIRDAQGKVLWTEYRARLTEEGKRYLKSFKGKFPKGLILDVRA